MNVNIWPPDSNLTPDFIINSSDGSVKARTGLKKTSYLQDVSLVCNEISYGGMLDSLIAAISIAVDELGATPQSQLSIRWIGQWPTTYLGQSQALYVYQRGQNGELQSDDSPEGLRIKYMSFQWKPQTYFKVVYEDSKPPTSNASDTIPNAQNKPLNSIVGITIEYTDGTRDVFKKS